MSVLAGRLLLAAALLGTVGSTLRHYPHQLAYFNELAGGPYNGWRHMLGSSLDWGQDRSSLRPLLSAHGYSFDPGTPDLASTGPLLLRVSATSAPRYEFAPGLDGVPKAIVCSVRLLADSQQFLNIPFDSWDSSDSASFYQFSLLKPTTAIVYSRDSE